MGEIVQKKMEQFAPSLLALKQSNIFTEDEVNKIIKKVKNYEHRLVGGGKSLELFKEAINYDSGVLMELRRRKKMKNCANKDKHLEWIFVKRIINNYQRAMKHFPPDYNLYSVFFDFLRYFPQQLGNMAHQQVKRFIQTFGHIPGVFRKVASWYIQIDKIDEARKTLLRGQSLHPNHFEIYLDLIELELRHEKPGFPDRLKEYVDEVIKNKLPIQFLVETLKLFDNVECLKTVNGTVDYTIHHMLTVYRDDAEVWHIVAQRELRGDYYPITTQPEGKGQVYSVERAIVRYKEGISKVPPAQKHILWKKYLNMLVDLQKGNDSTTVKYFLTEALKEAEKDSIPLDETHYTAWIDCCGNNQTLLVKKFKQGVEEHPKSIILWSCYLKFYLLQDESKQAEQIFEKAIEALGPDSFQIWDDYMDFQQLKGSTEELETLYERAINQPYEQVSKPFKSRFLSMTFLSRGIESARELYLKIADKAPYCKELHIEMMLAEEMESHNGNAQNNDIKRQVLEFWMRQFGDSDVDVYFQRMNYVREQFPQGINLNEKIGKIYEEAIRTLVDTKKVALFKERFHKEQQQTEMTT
ncbi:uncharacterized protein LOC126739642 [Anthonomus grandis grandis]|uniref:uncharacterized protein LOC126739642 n=1 Tax=Anthonomus grandis grandis TaxID=2921223 RepID=UPI0021658B58|nr:uncharacterized protein LOC126739642 [Anthonomus grandis grandis]XP_050301371.1 uncharacterized protein LOC126739642 [Anthonomus grandis grandis]XP_050301372.1 uncharacterized protein LOC126739642 [Anthonomus grandis grandis]XP_050301373.1 uncharacterized protein LOC126739642 [Anthonomus grandis grandis]